MRQIAFEYVDRGIMLKPDELLEAFAAKQGEQAVLQNPEALRRMALENPSLFKGIHDKIIDTGKQIGLNRNERQYLSGALKSYGEALEPVERSGNSIAGNMAQSGENARGLRQSFEGESEVARKYTDFQIDDMLKNIKGNGFKHNPLRQAYEEEVSKLAKLGDDLLTQGKSTEEVAQILNHARRDLGIKYKDMTPQPLKNYIYEINQQRYGDRLGPTFDDLLESKTYEQIINSSSKYNPDIDRLLSGFEQWLRRQ